MPRSVWTASNALSFFRVLLVIPIAILLASDDGGKTWTEPVPRLRAAALDQIQFIDLQTGWISGQNLSADGGLLS